MEKGLHNANEREVYSCWLNAVPGIGKAAVSKLLARCGDEEAVYRAQAGSVEEWEADGLLSQAQAQSLLKWKSEPEKEPFLLYQKMLQSGIRCVFLNQEAYPKRLGNIPDAPRQIYVKGGLPRENMPTVGIVGARFCSDYGRYVAKQYARELSGAGVQIISGMARGIDGIAHKAALDAGGSTFAVLGCGADICYPPENKDIYDRLSGDSGIISEYAPATAPRAGLFPQRNRIISGLSDMLLVVEARQKSGTLITVDQALEQGKEVYAVPGRVTDVLSAGCNRLIEQGAGIAISPQNLIGAVYELWQKRGGINEGRERAGHKKAQNAKHAEWDETQNIRHKGWNERQNIQSVERQGGDSGKGQASVAGKENLRLSMLNQEEHVVYDLLSVEGQTLDLLMSKSALDAGELTAALMRLCILGLAVCEQGRYRRNFLGKMTEI